MNAAIELLGFTASVMSFVLWWPQAALVWRCRKRGEQLRGVSTSSQLLLLMNALLWGAYAVGTGSLWVGAPGLVNGPLAVITIVVLRQARHGLPPLPEGTRPVHQRQGVDQLRVTGVGQYRRVL